MAIITNDYQILKEWQSKKRRMGCVSATNWFCRRIPKFHPLRLRRYLPNGNDSNGLLWEHVVATDGKVIIDLSPYADKPDS